MSTPQRSFDILPALHLTGGALVDHLAKTDGDHPVVDETDPLAAARECVAGGAAWLHVINIDTAFDPEASHPWELLKSLCELPIEVQYGGGIRNRANIDRAIEAGVSRVLLASTAITSPDIVFEAIAEHGRHRFGLSVTTMPDGKLFSPESRASGGVQAVTVAVQMAQLGIDTLVHSRLEPDGTMTGTDLDTSQQLSELSGMNVIVGGEVRELADVLACYNQPGITGVLIGKSLQNGTVSLGDALSETRTSLAFESGMPLWKSEQTTLPVRLQRALAEKNLTRHLTNFGSLRVLDAGGGSGAASIPLAQAGAQVDVVDSSKSMLDDLGAATALASYSTRLRGHHMDIREIPRQWPRDEFDLVMLHNVIQYSSDWEAMLVAALDRLAHGGLVSLIVRNWFAEPFNVDPDDHEASELPEMLERAYGPSRVFDTPVLLFSSTYLMDWLSTHGFDTLADYGLLCRHDVIAPVDGPAGEDRLLEKLVALESTMGQRTPFKLTARYIQIIARKR